MFSLKEISYAEKRRFKRILLPSGTTALFKDGKSTLDSVYVRNISEAGMLICDYSPGIRYPNGLNIYDIYINIPSSAKSGGFNIDRRVSLMINQGIVVRSYLDKVPYTSYYGISFEIHSQSPKEKLIGLVNGSSEPYL